MIAAAVAGAKFVHAEFALGRLPRLIPLVLVAAFLVLLIEPNAFSGAHHLEQGLYVVGLPILIYVIVRLARVERRPESDRVSAVMFAVAWGIFFLSSIPDLLISSRHGDLVGGVYGSSIGVALYVLVHSLVLARDRAVSARKQEELNRELQR